ncbi:hypothetical protein [Microtetraspora sp. NBRC 16547]|uniref:hypothetical protein n=1 Tax=Microtetraspora sp. NBRC 16547 TaxID=3030993 RepID=UPI0024A08366|nr:hypothetical protein [Microtetraspora sp. NBRC 16547]GLW96152.1 hypothetical protein Misp02_02390 [Microtetraspora sp. NBRC 16547]
MTSNGIRNLRVHLHEDVIPQFETRRQQMNETTLGPWALGMSGSAIILPTYERAVTRARDHLSDAIDAAEQWIVQLETAATNWRTAEDASTVKYV